jgi:hypothetical protein
VGPVKAPERRAAPAGIDFGSYMLVGIATGGHVFGAGAIHRPTANLDEIEAWLEAC